MLSLAPWLGGRVGIAGSLAKIIPRLSKEVSKTSGICIIRLLDPTADEAKERVGIGTESHAWAAIQDPGPWPSDAGFDRRQIHCGEIGVPSGRVFGHA